MRSGERRLAGEEFVQHDARAVDVGRRPRVLPVGQLRSHVHRRPDHPGEAGQGRPVRQPGDPEVGQASLRIVGIGDVDEHVGGFEITVDDPGRVHGAQRAQHLAGQGDRCGHRECAAFAQVDP